MTYDFIKKKIIIMTYDSKNEFKKYFVKIANSNSYINNKLNSQMGKLFFFFLGFGIIWEVSNVRRDSEFKTCTKK